MANDYQDISTRLVFEIDEASLSGAVQAVERAFNVPLLNNGLLEGLNNVASHLSSILSNVSERFNSSLASSSSHMSRVLERAQETANAVKDAADAGEEFAEEVKKAGKATENVTAGFQNLIGVMAKVGGVFAAAFSAKSIYDTSVAIQRSTAEFAGILGSLDAANTMLGKMRSYAVDTGFSFHQLQDAARGFVNAGMGATQVEDTLKRMHDIAGNNTRNFEILSDVINKSLVNMNKVERSSLFQLSHTGFNPMPYIARLRGISVEELNSSATSISKLKISTQELLDAIKLATSEGGAYFQNAARQAMTLDGRIQSFVGRWRQIFAEAFNEISPYLAKIVLAIDNFMSIVWDVGKFIMRAWGLPIFTAIVFISRKFNQLSEYMNKHKDGWAMFARVISYVIVSLGVVIAVTIFRIIGGFNKLRLALSEALDAIKLAFMLLTRRVDMATIQLALYNKEGINTIRTTYAKVEAIMAERGAHLLNSKALKGEARSQWLLNTAKTMGAALVLMAATEAAFNIYDRWAGKRDPDDWEGVYADWLGKGENPMKDLLGNIKKSQIDITQNFNLNAPTDKDGRTTLTPRNVMEVLRASRSDFSLEIQKVLMQGTI